MAMRDGVDQRIEVKRRQIWILRLDVDDVGRVIPRQMHMMRQVVVQIREGNPVLCPDGLTDNNLKIKDVFNHSAFFKKG